MKYGFVIPRHGSHVGGAETLVANLARKLAARGDNVDILTTCAREHRTWENFYPPGEVWDEGVRVERFLVDARNLDLWVPLQIQVSEGIRLSEDDQWTWMIHSVNSKSLYEFIYKQAALYDALFFAPYLFGTTFFGSLIAPERSYLIPCLHDEHYAYVDIIQSMFRQVHGCLFNAKAEAALARRLYGTVTGGEVGMGFDPPSDSEVLNLQPYFKEAFPYVLYVGRKEKGKNVHLLIDYFIALKDQGLIPADLRLVVLGGGSFTDLERPVALDSEDIIDLAHLSEEDKRRVIRHAVCLCQPSTNESFSIVLMEAWLLGTPVVVNSACDVTREHVVESSGGLYFSSKEDLGGVLSELCHSELRSKLGQAGREYVLRKYNWQAVL